jgi:double-stranded uracil-DNA glycosylase
MGRIIGLDPNAPYQIRLDELMKNHISIWDTLKACDREGSLDQYIDETTETPNDVKGLLSDYPTLRAIAFNGDKSWRAFQYHILPGFSQVTTKELQLLPMPSTSPANTRMSFEQKLARWWAIASYLKDLPD